MSWKQEPRTEQDHADNLQTLASVFSAMKANTHVVGIAGIDLPVVQTAENFYKFMLDGAQRSCQFAANKLREENKT